jgi:ribosomal protein S18 acetylase RimI-like enzyme
MRWRFATAEDSRDLAELNQQLIADEGHRNPMNLDQLEQRMLRWLESEYRAVLFYQSESVVAYALFREDESERIHLRQFFVARDRRRQGMGREVFRVLRKEIVPTEKPIVLEVLTSNPGARAFWTAQGFADYAATLELGAAEESSVPRRAPGVVSFEPRSVRVDVRAVSAAELREYAAIPIAFDVVEILDLQIERGGLGGFSFRIRRVDHPYAKDYDALDGGPTCWADRFDLTNWGMFAAHLDGRRVGAAAIALGTPGLSMLESETDQAVLWDIRVEPQHRRRGVASALVSAAEAWASARGCRELKVETQNVNVPACRFYMRHDFELGAINRFAYPSLPDEVRLLWYKRLASKSSLGM